MMIALDADTCVRLQCLHAVEKLIESHAAVGSVAYMDADEMADGLNIIVHAVSNGKDVAFDCNDETRKFVSGQ